VTSASPAGQVPRDPSGFDHKSAGNSAGDTGVSGHVTATSPPLPYNRKYPLADVEGRHAVIRIPLMCDCDGDVPLVSDCEDGSRW